MKNVIYKYMSLSFLSLCLMGMAQANDVICSTGECDDVEFSSITTFPDVACSATPVNRYVIYNLVNNEANTINLYDVIVRNQPGVPPDTSGATIIPVRLSAVTPVPVPALPGPDCLTANPVNNVGTGAITGYSTGVAGAHTCQLAIQVTPPTCAAGTPPIQKPITRQLFIGVGSQQYDLAVDIDAKVSVVGAGENFTVLGGAVANTAASNVSSAQVIGNLGSIGAPTGRIAITNGAAYTAVNDPIRTAAEVDYKSAFATLLSYAGIVVPPVTPQCQPRGQMDMSDAFYAGTYCLNANFNTSNFYLNGPITLVGDGTGLANFYFFVDSVGGTVALPNTGATCGTSLVPARCNLYVQPNVAFIYENGASADNVYWIIGNTLGSGQVLLGTNAELDGTVMHGFATPVATPAILAATSTSPTLVNGRLWASSGAVPAATSGLIQLQGNTIANLPTLKMLEDTHMMYVND